MTYQSRDGKHEVRVNQAKCGEAVGVWGHSLGAEITCEGPKAKVWG